MRILYAIQGTGNGHISRAMEILPTLQEQGEVDILISGAQSELQLPFPVKYQCHGLGFVFGKKGGIDLVKTYQKSRLKAFYKEVRNTPVNDYQLVISDFEPISAWACMQHRKHCIGLSNQASLLSPLVPKGKSEDFVGRFIIRNYAPCSINFGFSYEAYDTRIFTPVIRRELREAELSNKGHFTVYLPSYSDEKIRAILSQVKGANWQVFSKCAAVASRYGNVAIKPLNKELFEQSVTSAEGILTAAGFGTTTEALFMGKKLLVIPQKHQYEQSSNAAALKQMGVTVVKSLKAKHLEKIQHWIDGARVAERRYPDMTDEIISTLICHHHSAEDPYVDYITRDQYKLQNT